MSFVVATNKTPIGLHRFHGRRQGRASGQHCMNAMPTVMWEISKLPDYLRSNIERCAHPLMTAHSSGQNAAQADRKAEAKKT